MPSSPWNTLLLEIDKQLDREEINTWFGPLQVVSQDDRGGVQLSGRLPTPIQQAVTGGGKISYNLIFGS